MKKQNKILITVIILIFAIIGTVCAVGFTIGGKFGYLHLLVFLVISLVFSATSICFIRNKSQLKDRENIEKIILIAICFLAVFYGTYVGLNRFSASNEYITYESSIEYTFVPDKMSRKHIVFLDRNGNECEVVNGNEVWVDELKESADGKRITVKEQTGGFGYKIYSITSIEQ